MKDKDTQLLEEAYDVITESQWVSPDNPQELLDWVKRYHPKWMGKSELDTLRRILVTTDGLGEKVKERALQRVRQIAPTADEA